MQKDAWERVAQNLGAGRSPIRAKTQPPRPAAIRATPRWLPMRGSTLRAPSRRVRYTVPP